MNWPALGVGLAAFVIIGAFHPVVIKAEYYFSKKVWPVFLLAGLLCLWAALYIKNTAWACVVSVLGFTCLWSIKELFEQEKRVQRAGLPKIPNVNNPLFFFLQPPALPEVFLSEDLVVVISLNFIPLSKIRLPVLPFSYVK